MKKILFVCVALFVVGCSDKKDANRANFKSAISNYFAKNCILIDIDLPKTFKKYQDKKTKTFKLQPFYINSLEQYEYFYALGFLEKKEEIQKEKNWGNSYQEILLITYELSKKGQEQYQSSKKSFIGSQNGFCAGNYKVKEVQNFTKPADMLGYTMSEVKMSLSIDNIPDFAKTEKFKKVFKNFKAYTNKPESIVLVLTDNGWVSEQEIR